MKLNHRRDNHCVARTLLSGSTPLHLATLCGQTNMISLLVMFGADVNAPNIMGRTALDYARSPREPIGPGGFLQFIQMQRLMTEPLIPTERSIRQPLNQLATLTAQRRVAAILLEEAGGKRSQERSVRPR